MSEPKLTERQQKSLLVAYNSVLSDSLGQVSRDQLYSRGCHPNTANAFCRYGLMAVAKRWPRLTLYRFTPAGRELAKKIRQEKNDGTHHHPV